jgi:hypothetical protein
LWMCLMILSQLEAWVWLFPIHKVFLHKILSESTAFFLVFINWKERNPKKESEMSYNYLFNSWIKGPLDVIA